MDRAIDWMNNWRHLLIVVAVEWLAVSAVISVLEPWTFGESLYWGSITQTTIGYGDYSPASTWGRWIGVAHGYVSVFFLIPMFLVELIEHFNRSRDTFSHEEQEQIKHKLDLLLRAHGLLPTPGVLSVKGDLSEEEVEELKRRFSAGAPHAKTIVFEPSTFVDFTCPTCGMLMYDADSGFDEKPDRERALAAHNLTHHGEVITAPGGPFTIEGEEDGDADAR